MQKESVLIIVGILVASTLLLFAADWLGVPTGKATDAQNPGMDRIKQIDEQIRTIEGWIKELNRKDQKEQLERYTKNINDLRLERARLLRAMGEEEMEKLKTEIHPALRRDYLGEEKPEPEPTLDNLRKKRKTIVGEEFEEEFEN